MRPSTAVQSLCSLLLLAAAPLAIAQQCPSSTPAQGAPPPSAPKPVFPADNWWNADISAAPVDPSSAGFIAFLNNGGTRKLHPDFGGEASAGSTTIYGFPYAVVTSAQPKQAVTFDYDDESDGNGVPFYPIPTQAITQAHWIENGAPGNVDQRDDSDRHLLIIDCTSNTLYELYSVYYNGGKWLAGSGAFFDMDTNDRRPDGWTSADAAGLAIFPGLVRYDEAANAAVPEINHALRVTVRASNGAVFPASHVAGATAGALPMGARLRLKKNVNGVDPATRTSDPTSRKIFRAMQKYGLIVADNGSDMFVSGTFDLRWNSDALNPAFATLSASDFEVIQRGWKPPAVVLPVLGGIAAAPNPVVGGQASTGTVSLSAKAPAGGVVVQLSSSSGAFSVPGSVTVPAGASSASFAIATVPSTLVASGTLSASYSGVTKTTALTISASLKPGLSIDDAWIREGDSGTKQLAFTVRRSGATAGAVSYSIATSNGSAIAGKDYAARSLSGETIASGQTSRSFAVAVNGNTTADGTRRFAVTLTAPNGATLVRAHATGSIIDNDVAGDPRPAPGRSKWIPPSTGGGAPRPPRSPPGHGAN